MIVSVTPGMDVARHARWRSFSSFSLGPQYRVFRRAGCTSIDFVERSYETAKSLFKTRLLLGYQVQGTQMKTPFIESRRLTALSAYRRRSVKVLAMVVLG